MARTHRPVRSRVTGRPTVFKEEGLPIFENRAPEPPTLKTTQPVKTQSEPLDTRPWYERQPRNRGTAGRNNAGRVNDLIDDAEERQERNAKGITGERDS